MKNSKLFTLFAALQPDEYRWLLDYLRSPYFNRNTEVLRLAEVLIALLRRDAPPESYQAERIVSRLTPGIEFERKVFNHLTSKLLKLTERFLAQRVFDEEEGGNGYYGLRAVRERGLQRSWRSHGRAAERVLSERPLTDPDQLLTEFKLRREHHRWFTRSGARTHNPFIQETSDALDRFYFAQKLKLSCTMVNAKLAIGSPLQFRFLSGIATEELYELPASELARLYAEAYQLLTSKNDVERLRGYLRLVRRHATRLKQEETSELFNHAINYCVRQIRAGHRDFIQDLLNLYQDNLRAGYLFDRAGELSPWNYKNIVKLGLGVKAFDWATEVVERYTKRLPQEAQSDAYHFSMADISYHQKEYDEALDFLNRTEFTDIHYALGAKVMLIKVYFETDAWDALESLLFSFKIYLKRNRRIGQENKVAYHNFARFTEQLLKGGDREKLRGKIESAKQLWDRSWLLNKL